MTNDKAGTIKAEHKAEIVEVFGETGKRIAERLAADPKATFLGELFKDFAKGK